MDAKTATMAPYETRAWGTKVEVTSCRGTIHMDPKMEAIMPILLWLLGVPLVVVIALMLTHVI